MDGPQSISTSMQYHS